MRVNERKGAWILLSLLLSVGILLWVMGKCEGHNSEKENRELVEIMKIPVENRDTADGTRMTDKKYKNRKKSQKSGNKKSQKRGPKNCGTRPVRDILSDTILQAVPQKTEL